MKIIFILSAFILLSFCQVQAANYAVLVAGSNGYWNYRHQADTCHAYKTLITKGVPAENIIVFSYNDVASDPSNPFPGKLFNAPSAGVGIDVNADCKIDYEGNDVNSTNYLNVITGQAKKLKGIGSGRVLNSTAEDYVFLNFVDHGAAGLIAFPNDYLYANDFLTALNTMHTKKMYKQLVYYLEACESGSMFLNLTDNANIYALSAANATESSWATYCSPDDYVNGTELQTCLGDLFSVNWMQNTDASNTLKETLEQQWKIVANLTNQSSVLQWGQQTFTGEVIGEFVGEKQSSKFRPSQNYMSQESQDIKIRSAENSRMVKRNYLYRQWQKDKNNVKNKQAFLQEENSQLYFIQTFESIAIKANLQIGNQAINIKDWDCLKKMVQNFEQNCMKFSEFGLKYVYYLADVCENTFMEGGLEGKLDFVTNICKKVGLGIEETENFKILTE